MVSLIAWSWGLAILLNALMKFRVGHILGLPQTFFPFAQNRRYFMKILIIEPTIHVSQNSQVLYRSFIKSSRRICKIKLPVTAICKHWQS
jgi:hypothetical protein